MREEDDTCGGSSADEGPPVGSRESWRRYRALPRLLAIVFVGMCFISQLGEVLKSSYQHDLPIMLYEGYLQIEHGFVPYKDFFEFNPPGTMLSYRLIYACTRGDQRMTMGLHIGCTLLTMVLAGIWLWPYSREGAFFGALIFAQWSFQLGSDHTLQREFLCSILIATSLVLATRLRRGLLWRLAAIGALHSLIFLIKPIVAIGLPVIGGAAILLSMDERPSWRRLDLLVTRRITSWLALGCGFLLMTGAILGWLALSGALDDFIWMTRNYWPLYTSLGGTAVVSQHSLHSLLVFLTSGVISKCVGRFLPAAAVCGLVLACVSAFGRKSAESDRSAMRIDLSLLCLLAVAYLFRTWFVGKYWNYHFYPVVLILSLLCGFLFLPSRKLSLDLRVLIMILALFLVRNTGGHRMMRIPRRGFPQRVEAAVRHLEPLKVDGDSIQFLDLSRGGAHTALILDMPLATPFLYDFHFYHHVETETIRELRARFLTALVNASPRFIVDFPEGKWRPTGKGTVSEWPELDEWIARNYSLTHLAGVEVHERIESNDSE